MGTDTDESAPWCGHCKNLAPAYNKVASNLKGLVHVSAIDCDAHQGFCGQYGVKGFPTIKTVRPRTGADGKETWVTEDYNGERTAGAITDHAVSIMPSRVERLTSEKVDNYLSKNRAHLKVVLFTKKGAISARYRALSTSFPSGVKFLQIRGNQDAALKHFNVTDVPHLLVLSANSDEAQHYTGKMERDGWSAFVAQYMNESSASDTASCPMSGESKEETCDTETKDNTVQDQAQERPSQFTKALTTTAIEDACFSQTSQPCLLVPAPLLSDLAFSSKQTGVTFVEYGSEAIQALQERMLPSDKILYLNSKRKWYLSTDAAVSSNDGIREFVDLVKQGEAGKKVKYADSIKVEL